MPINESDYIVSRSNYVISKKHQDTDKGEIYERDITTIGGRNHRDSNQRPVYQSSNFIITTSNTTPLPKPANEIVWDTNNEGSVEWSWNDVDTTIEETDSSASLELNPDIYDLRNFAYYGSCVELIRGSLNHILETFPGEVFATDQHLTYYDKSEKEFKVLDGNWFLVDNPFSINLHSPRFQLEEGESPLKYLNDENVYKTDYEIITRRGLHLPIAKVSYEPENFDVDDDKICPYAQVGTLTVDSSGYTAYTIRVKVYKGAADDVIYLTKKSGWHIRPISQHYSKFKQDLSVFEKTLLNEYSEPRYASVFEIYSENEFGYESSFENFTFPIGLGGYNLGVALPGYKAYVEKLTNIATFYDECFCDNLYRSMTHEAIKNFDWSYKREYSELEEDEHLEGGGRMQKIIRLIGREFDEIKLYIDNIAHASRVTYDAKNNTPDYLLTDQIELEGWDYKEILPYIFNEATDIYTLWDKQTVTPYTANEEIAYCDANTELGCGSIMPITTYTSNTKYSGYDINTLFLRLLKLNSRSIWRKKGCVGAIESLLSLFGLRSKHWAESMAKSQIKFEDTLPSNADGSKPHLCDVYKVDANEYDYDIIEGVTYTEPLPVDEDMRILNRDYKYIVYDDTDDWAGLPVKEKDGYLYPHFDSDADYDGHPYYQMNGGWLKKMYTLDKDNKLIDTPFFTETIRKVRGVSNLKALLDLPSSILKDGEICYVEDLSPKYAIIDGFAYELTEYSQTSDKFFYGEEHTAYSVSAVEFAKPWYYFEATVRNSSIIIGNKIYADCIHVHEPDLSSVTANESRTVFDIPSKSILKPLNEYKNGTVIRLYIKKDNISIFTLNDVNGTTPLDYNLILSEDIFTIPRTNVQMDDRCVDCMAKTSPIYGIKRPTPTHYFKLYNVAYSGKIHAFANDTYPLGWQQLIKESADYKALELKGDYYKGNNPHTASFMSDSGYAYIDNFKHLFGYAIDNDMLGWEYIYRQLNLLDSRTQLEFRQKAYNFGFSFRADKTSADCNDYTVYEDSKIHNYTEQSDKTRKSTVDFEKTDLDSKDSDCIVNTKRTNIIFRCDPVNEKEKFKYIDSVVIPYLSQVIPSTLITTICYES